MTREEFEANLTMLGFGLLLNPLIPRLMENRGYTHWYAPAGKFEHVRRVMTFYAYAKGFENTCKVYQTVPAHSIVRNLFADLKETHLPYEEALQIIIGDINEK